MTVPRSGHRPTLGYHWPFIYRCVWCWRAPVSWAHVLRHTPDYVKKNWK